METTNAHSMWKMAVQNGGKWFSRPAAFDVPLDTEWGIVGK